MAARLVIAAIALVAGGVIFVVGTAMAELSVSNALLFAILWSLRFRLRRPGLLFVTYVIIYSVGQFFLFFWRDNEVLLWGLKQAQLTALVVLVLALPLWWWLSARDEARNVQPAPQTQSPSQ